MSTETLLRKHFEAAAVQVEVTETPVDEIVGRVRNTRIWFGLGAIAAVLLAVVAVAGLMSRDTDDLVGPPTTIVDGTAMQQIAATLPESFNPNTAIAIFTGTGTAENIALEYLGERLGVESRVLSVELVGPGLTAVRIESGHLGWVLIRRGEGDISEVIASTTDGVDLSATTMRSGQIAVRIEAIGVGILSLDVLELSGDPVAGAETLGVADATQPEGEATLEFSTGGIFAPLIIRAHDNGGTQLSVSEFIIEPEPGTAVPETTEAPEVSDPEATSAPTTTVPDDVVIAWTAADAERDVENFLAALAAGAYEQAAWPLDNNGVMFDGQGADETPAQYLERICAGGACAGPYTVTAAGPGIVNEFGQASSIVAVAPVGSGDAEGFTVFTFEGQRMVSGVPPQAVGGEAPLVAQLFGSAMPERVVVQRFDAFEIWEGGESQWVTNWWANDVDSIEQAYAASRDGGVVALRDSQQQLSVRCGDLMTRGEAVVVVDRCLDDGRQVVDVESGELLEAPTVEVTGEVGWPWFSERGGTTVTGEGDAEGNLIRLESDRGVDLAGDDYIGHLKLSVDGSKVAYVDHGDPNTYSHFWSPVVVVKDVVTGTEIGRWVLDGPVIGLEFSGDWVVAWEGSSDPEDLVSGLAPQLAAVAINISTNEVNRVETHTRVFLPS